MVSQLAPRGRRKKVLTTTSSHSRTQVGPGKFFGDQTTIVSPQKCTAALRRRRCPALTSCIFREPGDSGATPRFGVCRAFAAPDVPAPRAPVLWLSDYAHPTVTFDADYGGLDHERDFDIAQFPFAVHVHFDASGLQHVVLKSPSHYIACLISGAIVTAGAVRPHFTMRSVAGLDASLGGLGVFARAVLGQRPVVAADLPGPVDRLRLRDAIIAVDGERAGASRRQIATVIYGLETVTREWSDPSGRLKAVIKRDVQRGRRLVAGEWRAMVARRTFRAEA